MEQTLKEKIEKQIKFANDKVVQAEEDGDNDAVEAWKGYVHALRWVLETMKDGEPNA